MVCADTNARRASFAPVLPGSQYSPNSAAKCANDISIPSLRRASSSVCRRVCCSDFNKNPMPCSGLSSFIQAPYASEFLGIDFVASYQQADIISAS